MKKSIYTLLLLGLTASCNNEKWEGEGEANVLSFCLTLDGEASVESRAASKVTDMTVADFASYGFDIAGYGTVGRFEDNVQSPSNYGAPVPNIFGLNEDKIAVPHIARASDGNYKSPLSKIPLSEGSYLSFYAWTQNQARNAQTGIVEATDSDTDQNYPYLKVVVIEVPGSQGDIVAARSIDRENDYVISAVDLDFAHILSKLTFRAKSPTKNLIKIDEVKINYAGNKVHRGGTFTFGSGVDLGGYSAYTGYNTGAHSLGSAFANISGGSTTELGELLILPQELEDGFASLDITYRVVLYDAVEQKVSKSVPLKALSLAPGSNYIITLSMSAYQVSPLSVEIADWKVGATSSIPIPPPPADTEVLLLLDGNDAPYTNPLNGKKYWLDRSGNNRHCEIQGNVVYDVAAGAYQFPGTEEDRMMTPALGTLGSEITVQLIADAPGGAKNSQEAFYFSDVANFSNRIISTHLSFNGNNSLYFDAGTGGSSGNYDRMQAAISSELLQRFSLYTYRKHAPTQFMAMSRNNTLHSNAGGKTQALGQANYNTIGRRYTGRIKYFKLTRRSIKDTEMVDDYVKLKERYGMTHEPLLPPVTNNLVLCLDGRTGKEWVDGKRVWRDQSTYGNHAELVNDSRIEWSSISKSFTFKGESTQDRMKLPLITTNGFFTIEVVVKPADRTYNRLLSFDDYNPKSTNGDAVISGTKIVMPNGTNQIFWSTSKYGDAVNRIIISNLTNLTTVKQYSFKRDPSLPKDVFLEVRQNGNIIGIAGDGRGAQAMTFGNACFIGGDCGFDDIHNPTNNHYQGEIMAIRLYSYPLTDAELVQNAAYDKATYGITD